MSTDPRDPLERLLDDVQQGLAVIVVLAVLGLVALVLFGSARAQAQTTTAPAFRCAPKEIGGAGTAYRTVLAPEGDCEVWWCPVSAPAGSTEPATTAWWAIEARCALAQYRAANAADPMAIARGIAGHPDGVLAGINQAAAALSVKPANAAEAYAFATLRHQACQEATRAPLMVPGQVIAPGYCGPAPVPPAPPPAPAYTVKTNGIYPTRPAYELANGVRGTREVGRATVGQPCNTTRPVLAVGVTADLWAEFGPDFAPGRVAVCSKGAP